MNRLFGSSKPKPKPNLTETITKIDARTDAIDQKIRKLDTELAKYRDQLARLPANHPSRNNIKSSAMRVLQQKRQYEQQRGMMAQQSFNMEQTAFATESLQGTVETVQAMKHSAKEMKQQMKVINIDKVEDLHEELTDLLETSNEIQEVLGRSYTTPDEMANEDDLEAELAGLSEMPDLETEGGASYLDAIPSVPQKTVEDKQSATTISAQQANPQLF